MKNKFYFLLTIFCCCVSFAFSENGLSKQLEIIKKEAELLNNSASNIEQQEVKRSLILMTLRHLEAIVDRQITNREKKIVRYQEKIHELDAWGSAEEYDEESSSDKESLEKSKAKRLQNYSRKIDSLEKSLIELKELQLNIEKLKGTI